jgi:Cys-rich protein (TIGR01571 family)
MAGVQGGYPPVQAGYPAAQGGYPQAQPVQGSYPAAVPVYAAPGPVAPSQWQAGLCEWYKEFGVCIITCCVPCITFGQTAEIIDNGITTCATAGALCCLIHFVTGCGCLYTCGFRQKLRNRFGLPASPCNDCCVHCTVSSNCAASTQPRVTSQLPHRLWSSRSPCSSICRSRLDAAMLQGRL